MKRELCSLLLAGSLAGVLPACESIDQARETLKREGAGFNDQVVEAPVPLQHFVGHALDGPPDLVGVHHGGPGNEGAAKGWRVGPVPCHSFILGIGGRAPHIS